MGVSLKGRNFLTLMDFTPEEIRYLLDLAKELKAKKKAGIRGGFACRQKYSAAVRKDFDAYEMFV